MPNRSTRKKCGRRSKRVRTRQRRSRGGALIGKGSYGCGFFPSLRCHSDDERNPFVFSKLLHQQDAWDEFNQTRRIKEADWEERFCILPLFEPCEIVAHFANQAQDLKQCDDYWKSKGKPPANTVLHYHYGGITLDNIRLIDGGEWVSLFRGLRNLFEGLNFLHMNGFVHTDLKQNNVVAQKETNIVMALDGRSHTSKALYKVRLIDFGLALDLNDIEYQTEEIHHHGGNSIYRPFDLRYIQIVPQPETVAENVQRYNALLFKLKNSYMFTLPSEFFIEEGRPRITEEFVKTVLLTKSYPAICPLLATSGDVYSLGLMIGVLYGRWTRHTIENGVPTCVLNNIAEHQIQKVPFTPALKTDFLHMSEEMYAWHETVFRDVTIPFYRLIGKMMEVDPEKRPTAAAALAEYSAFLSLMEPYFTKENVDAFVKPVLSYTLPAAPPAPPVLPAPPPIAAPLEDPALPHVTANTRSVRGETK